MNTILRSIKVSGTVLLAALGAVSMSSCGNDASTSLAPPTPTQLGGTVNLACALGGSPAGGSGTGTQQGQSSKQQQIPFQQKPECQQQQQNNPAQQQQQLTFAGSKVSDFDISVDCVQRRVVVRSKGQDQKTSSLPIRSDGTVVGELNFINGLENDGKGSGSCWVGYKVAFNGKVDCNANKPGTSEKNPEFGKVSLSAEVAFNQTNSFELQQAGIASIGDDVTTGTAVDTGSGNVAGIVPSPSPSASSTPTPTPTPSASVTLTPVPIPLPSSTITPIRVCIIENPCPVVGKADLTCPQ